MPGPETERRQWKCPYCGQGYRIPVSADDPMACPQCAPGQRSGAADSSPDFEDDISFKARIAEMLRPRPRKSVRSLGPRPKGPLPTLTSQSSSSDSSEIAGSDSEVESGKLFGQVERATEVIARGSEYAWKAIQIVVVACFVCGVVWMLAFRDSRPVTVTDDRRDAAINETLRQAAEQTAAAARERSRRSEYERIKGVELPTPLPDVPLSPFGEPLVKESELIKRAKDAVRAKLFQPHTASFPWHDYQFEWLNTGTYGVRSYVESQNAFGATIRQTFHVVLKQHPDGIWEVTSMGFPKVGF